MLQEVSAFPKGINQLQNLRWLRLNRTQLESLPSIVALLTKLEHLDLEHNSLLNIPPSVSRLRNLQSFRVRARRGTRKSVTGLLLMMLVSGFFCRVQVSHNDLHDEDIPEELFTLDELVVLDLSHNALQNIPPTMKQLDSLLVLALGNNQLSTLPTEV